MNLRTRKIWKPFESVHDIEKSVDCRQTFPKCKTCEAIFLNYGDLKEHIESVNGGKNIATKWDWQFWYPQKKGQLSSLWFEDQKNLRKYFESGHGTNEKAKCPKLRCRLQNSNFGLFSAINGFCSNDLTRANWPDKICDEISDSFELREVQEKKICQNPATKLDWSVKSENMWWNLWRWPSIQTLFYFNLIDKHEKYRNVVF